MTALHNASIIKSKVVAKIIKKRKYYEKKWIKIIEFRDLRKKVTIPINCVCLVTVEAETLPAWTPHQAIGII